MWLSLVLPDSAWSWLPVAGSAWSELLGGLVLIVVFCFFYSPYLPWKQFKQHACSPTVSSLIHSVHMVVVDTLIFITNDT